MVNNDWLDIDVLEDYLDGKLDAKAMHFVERQALEDPFVAEALEGLKQSPKRKQTLSILQKQLYDRVSEKPIKRKLWGITTQRLSIAATATVAFIAVSILFFMRETNRRNAEVAARKKDGVIVRLDSSTAVASTQPKTDTAVQSATQTALVDKAIADAKNTDLAKNTKTNTIIQPAPQEIVAAKPTIGYNRAKLAKAEKMNTYAEKAKADQSVLNEVKVAAAPAIASNKIAFTGNVVDQSNGQPIQGAVVKLAGSKNVTATDAKGYFYLPADSNAKDKDLLINAIGFKEAPVVGIQDPNAIKSALSGNKSLNEIALITGSNGQKKENIPAPKITLRAEQNLDGKATGEITKPVPVSTINYTQYLENNNKLYNPKGPEQFVILSFKVKKNGRPSNIVVIKSLNKKADAEAVRLIRVGPDWVLPKKGTDLVEISVKF
ncbi:carboxypeptidase-like regulatory domain-containing protein [Pedobacter roseus]|uniref:Carboxypeptidase-like regulatory domain-containing protein n=1 Tax=Pedobacter roseus TaxID=336820 RepID=A0A7G9QEU8_9SPHI|nr:carboxypeptidase-like regulatory domain-containing protein [Pedobacter roseus]QNN41873.1 carboxypeptidase-like regulatory domain-containing protein [Pedobacter roseus]